MRAVGMKYRTIGFITSAHVDNFVFDEDGQTIFNSTMVTIANAPKKGRSLSTSARLPKKLAKANLQYLELFRNIHGKDIGICAICYG